MVDAQPEAQGHHCGTCDKTFSTNSHLRRHEALHTGRTSAVCPSCNKRFSRLDTARRHMKACSPENANTIAADSRRGKAPRACDTCAQRKLSCNATSPCSRCIISKVRCTFERQNVYTSTASVDRRTEDSGSLPAITPGNAEDLRPENRGKIPIEFLMAFTAPAEHEATTTLISNGQESSFAQDSMPLLGPPSRSEFNFEAYDTLFWDQENWTPEFFQYLNQDLPVVEGQYGSSSTLSQAESVISSRLVQLTQDLARTHARLHVNNQNSHVEYDPILAEQLFTPMNAEAFTQSYFRQLHQYYPFVYRPSFDCETSSLPLLLAIFLFGSLCSAPTDSTLAARKFFDVAEEYLFSHPIMRELHDGHAEWVWSDENIEVLQAVLVIEIVQNGTNNVKTRRRLRTKRHPTYISNLKSIGLFQTSDPIGVDMFVSRDSKWQSFVSSEKRTRLATWAFVMDSCFSIMFNSCPQITAAELNFDFPSCDQLFEATTATEYDSLALVNTPALHCRSPSRLIKDLLQDSWVCGSYSQATAMQLSLAICGLQSLSMTAKYSFTLPATETVILRAADRWQVLWRFLVDVSNDSRSAPAQPLSGFLKHSEELCWFVRKLLHAARLGASNCRYMRTMPTDDIEDLHDFLCKDKMK